jgi:hypothetical protein
MELVPIEASDAFDGRPGLRTEPGRLAALGHDRPTYPENRCLSWMYCADTNVYVHFQKNAGHAEKYFRLRSLG